MRGLGGHQGGLPHPFDDPVSEGLILAGHFEATALRTAAVEGLVLVLQDTAEFVYQQAPPKNISYTKYVNSGRDKGTALALGQAMCGVLMHARLAITLEKRPLG